VNSRISKFATGKKIFLRFQRLFSDKIPVKTDVLIIGAGVVGLSIARELSKYNVKVVVVEKECDVGLGLTSKNMGVIHPFIPHSGTQKFKLCIEGNRYFDDLSKELSIPFERRGLLIVALSRLESLFLHFVKIWLKLHKIPYKSVKKDSLITLEPNISENARYALFIPSAGITDPVELAIALAENAMDNGVKIILECEVNKISKERSCFRVKTNRGEILARYVINAGGLDSDKIISLAGEEPFKLKPGLGVMIVMEPRRETMHSHIVAEVPLRVDPRTKGGAAGITVYNKLIWGPNLRDVENRDDDIILRDDIDFILEKFGKLFHRASVDDIIYFYSGVRPASEDGDFIIRISDIDGLIDVAGIQSPGLTAAPAIAKRVISLLNEAGLKLEKKENFNPYRSQIPKIRFMDYHEIEEKTSENRLYKRVICSEVPISEGEVVEAIKRGARTIKSVFNRLGLAWDPIIQSECAIKVAEIIARETGRNLNEITFEGKSTEIGVDPL